MAPWVADIRKRLNFVKPVGPGGVNVPAQGWNPRTQRRQNPPHFD